MSYYKINEVPNLKVQGRTAFVGDTLPLFWNGSSVDICVNGSECYIDVEIAYEIRELWASVIFNGNMLQRILLTKGSHRICLFTGMDKNNYKTVRFMRETQPMGDDPSCTLIVKGLETDGEFRKVPAAPLRLEFIGDSLTTGEGTYGKTTSEGPEMEWLPMWMSNTHQYSFMIANELNADYNIISQSGWGVHCAWDNNIETVLPRVYEKVCGPAANDANLQLGALKDYDFSFNPHVIIINLGTNDNSSFYNAAWTDPKTGISYKMHTLEDGTLNPEDLELFITDTEHFADMLRTHNPNAHILWVYGMCGGELDNAIKEGLKRHSDKTSDKNIAFLRLPAATPETTGSRMHPGLKNHIICADILVDYIKKLKLNQ